MVRKVVTHSEARTPRPIRVAGLLYDGALALDLIGPLEALNFASLELAGSNDTVRTSGYFINFLASHTDPIITSVGARICADHKYTDYADGIDILVVPGQRSGDTRYRDPQLFAWLKEQEKKVSRIVSICSGAYVLAEAGLLNGKRVTTHWMHSESLQRAHPDVQVEDDKIFCRDGLIYSSGGVTAGVDLALSIIEEDFGRVLALKVAKRMVVFLKRQGDQSQFSELLSAQSRAERFASVIDWIENNIHQNISVERLAKVCAMSPRNFSRQFRREIGRSPMTYVDLRRLDRAKRLLEETHTSIAAVADSSGFATSAQFRRAFLRVYGVTPLDYRAHFGLAENTDES